MSSYILHKETLAFIKTQQESGAKPYYDLSSVQEARDLSYKSATSYNIDYNGDRSELFVPSKDVAGGIPIYVYSPNERKPDPTILIFYHGGGMVVGTRANAEVFCKTISMRIKCIVVNVEYRLGPEHKFPAGNDDACTVALWVLQNKLLLGGSEKSSVGVAGDSAGGHLAACTSHDVQGLNFQVLVYPHLLARGDRSLPSYKEFSDGPLLTSKMIDWFESQQADEKDYLNPRLAALLRPSFEHLPPAIFIVAQCDPVRDDSYEYSKKLTKAGVYNELHLIEGAIHAFFSKPQIFVELCGQAYEKVFQFVEKYSYH